MKTPKTIEELLNLVNADDLYNVLTFSGINDHLHYGDKKYKELKNEFTSWVYNNNLRKYHNTSKDKRIYDPNVIHEGYSKLTNEHYNILILLIQDFYIWSDSFSHIHSSVYKRIINSLDIEIYEIRDIYTKIENCSIDTFPKSVGFKFKDSVKEKILEEIKKSNEIYETENYNGF
jgi:hypothetical protein